MTKQPDQHSTAPMPDSLSLFKTSFPNSIKMPPKLTGLRDIDMQQPSQDAADMPSQAAIRHHEVSDSQAQPAAVPPMSVLQGGRGKGGRGSR